MALETRIPKEITDYREKIVFGLSGRQLLSLTAAIAVVCLTAFVLWYLLGVNFSIVEYILILEALPFVAFGFVRHKGMPFEQFAHQMELPFRTQAPPEQDFFESPSRPVFAQLGKRLAI